MTLLLAALILLSVASLVAGQVFLKHAMNLFEQKASRSPPPPSAVRMFAAGIASMTLWFFLWMGLLKKLDLSFLYPFEAVSSIFICAAAVIFLGEKMTLRLWGGVLLIVLGGLLVSAS